MATMDDIAKHLGISKSTVSKAFSGAEDVSETMRRAVVECAVELGYTRASRSCKQPQICIFIENMAYEAPDDFGWDLVTGFRKMAEPDGFAVDIIPLNAGLQKQHHYDEYMLLHDYRGALFLGTSFYDAWLSEFRSCRTPTVLLDNQVRYNSVVTQVGCDTDEGMEAIIERLMELGHRKIGYVGGGLGSQIYQERYSAFFRALRRQRLDDSRSLASHAYSTQETLDIHLPRLLDQSCTAIICSHDLLARDVLGECLRRGLRVPEDLSIIGIDDLPLCTTTEPTLSSLRQDRTELGKSAYHALASQMNHIHISTMKIHPEVILRGSVGPAPRR